MKTTLNAIRKHEPCTEGWKKLLTHLGKTQADDEPLSLLTIIDSNGLDDALWCLRAVEGRDKEIRLFAVWCARQVQHLLKDQRSLDALDVAERYANGEATDAELKDAWEAAVDAARATAWNAVRAARSAAWSAAWVNIRSIRAAAKAALDTALAAKEGAAWAVNAATWSAADATREATRAKQEAELRRICEEG